jgi:hypothetical protein
MIINAPDRWVKCSSPPSAAERLAALVLTSEMRVSPEAHIHGDSDVNFMQRALCAI